MSNEAILQIAMVKVTMFQTEAIMLEAALNEAHQEIDRLRRLVPSDEEVTSDDEIPAVGPV